MKKLIAGMLLLTLLLASAGGLRQCSLCRLY